MIQIISGQTGEGKTKQMIALANEKNTELKGHIVYVDNTTQHRFDLSHQIRLIETPTFPIQPQDFFGFLCGILSSNHDIELIFIDELVSIASLGLEELGSFVYKLKNLSEKHHVHFVIGTAYAKGQLPLDLHNFLVA